MTRSTNMEHVEVLRHMKETIRAIMPSEVAALDAAIAALSAPQSGDWVLVPREPTEAMLSAAGRLQACECGFVGDMSPMDGEEYAAMLAAAPQPPAEAQADHCSDHQQHVWGCRPCEEAAGKFNEPAEAQPVAWRVEHDDGGSHIMDAATVDNRFREALKQAGRRVTPLYAHPPPSAPVGVEAGWYRYNKPAPRWEDTKFGKWLDPAVYGPPREQHGYSLEVAPLAQQPAAVDEAMVDRVASALDHWDGSDHDSDYYDELARVAVEAVFSAQTGGSENDR